MLALRFRPNFVFLRVVMVWFSILAIPAILAIPMALCLYSQPSTPAPYPLCPPISTQGHPRSPNPPKNRQRVANSSKTQNATVSRCERISEWSARAPWTAGALACATCGCHLDLSVTQHQLWRWLLL